jgi:SAM-dependent methyltransferase
MTLCLAEEAAACPICNDTRVQNVAPYRHYSPVFTNLSRLRCDGCGLVFASPMPDAAALNQYNSTYFAAAHGGIPADAVSIAYHAAINRLRVIHVENYLGARCIVVGSVLEIGPGGGHFANSWLERHSKCEYAVVESDITMHAWLRSLGIDVRTNAAAIPATASIDLVVMSHVLEHTTSPAAFIADTTAALKQGGVLFIEVPCRDFEFKPMDEPHLLFFDKSSLDTLLSACGFGHIQLTYHGRTIEQLRSESKIGRAWARARAHLLARGIVAPFASDAPELDVLQRPLERAAVAPFEAHHEQVAPAGWLRAMAVKL